MKPENKPGPDKVEKELKGLINRLNSENAALAKILSLVGLNEPDRITETPAEKSRKNQLQKTKPNKPKPKIKK